jgi:hypothetical protein
MKIRTSVVSPDTGTRPRSMAKAPTPGQDIAAILRIRDKRPVDKHLQEQIINIAIVAFRRRNHRHLAGQRIGTAHAVNLPGVG